MKNFSAIFLLISVALAQSPSSATPPATGNPLIPDDISEGCKAFLNKFNEDPSLTACTDSLIKTTQDFGPGGSSSPSKAEVTGAVDSICTGSTSTACPDSLIRGTLADFYKACSEELTSKRNEQVCNTYDVLYVITPLKKALCSKDDSSNYCVTPSNDATSTGIKGALTKATGDDLSNLQQHLAITPASPSRRADEDDAVMANLTTFRTTNLPFLFRQPDMDSATLCTTCTRNILTSYFNFESDVPYAPGLTNSPTLSGQNPLVAGIQNQCGANFLSGAVQAAGGIQQGFNAAVRDVSNKLSTLVVIAGFTIAVSSL